MFSNMDIFKTIFIFSFLGLGGTVAQKQVHDCKEIEYFVGQYVRLLNQLPVQTYPVNSFCTSNQTVSHYKTAVEWFHYAQGNKTCEKNLNQNRLNVFQTLYDQITSIWDAAHCQDCVANQNDTAEFFQYYDELQNCAKNYTNPCDVCAGNYNHMQVYYEGLVQNRKGLICFDIEDRMNQTRYAWSAIYNCCKGKQHSQTAFIWFASGISSLPVIFYVMMYLITCRKEARERAAAPLLNDRTVAGTVEERDEPQASTSSVPQQLHDKENEDDRYSVEAEPKLNNLDKAAGVRESKLIDLDSESRDNLNSNQDLKSLPNKNDDDDDVSILRSSAVNVGVGDLFD
ncbi:uncharacterized protein LOC135698827 [Ochlerotatus camptorhynchus]|uniref:uncharacterized protein LOC135698827 n=1 Tax=Ochlerotatus camptorhynchus TaxID=644619 RepID=UPI0031DAB9FD